MLPGVRTTDDEHDERSGDDTCAGGSTGKTCAGWECNHFHEHFLPRRGGGAYEQKRWDHHRGVMQRRWLPTSEVDCCCPAAATPPVTAGRGAKGVLAVEMVALALLAGELYQSLIYQSRRMYINLLF